MGKTHGCIYSELIGSTCKELTRAQSYRPSYIDQTRTLFQSYKIQQYSLIVDLDALKKKPKKAISDDEEEVDEDYNPYLDPEDRENGGDNANDDEV